MPYKINCVFENKIAILHHPHWVGRSVFIESYDALYTKVVYEKHSDIPMHTTVWCSV